MKPMTITLDYQDYLELVKKAEKSEDTSFPDSFYIRESPNCIYLNDVKYVISNLYNGIERTSLYVKVI
jgi:hypothetical protein